MIEAGGRDRVGNTVSRFLADWRASGIAGVVLRGYEGLPTRIENDLDILVEKPRVREFEQLLLRAATADGLKRFARIERSAGSPVAHRFLDPESGRQLSIDLFTNLNWRGLSFLSARSVLDGRVAIDTVDIPRPGHEAAASLFSKILHGSWVPEDRRERIRELALRDENEFVRVSELAFGRSVAQELLARVTTLRLSTDRAETGRLRRALVRRAFARSPIAALTGVAADVGRIAHRVRRPSGVFIALVGPDGSGKSTLAEPLADRLAGRLGGVNGHTFHWKPKRLRGAGGGPVTSPHARPPRSRAASRLWLGLHLAEFTVGYFTAIYPRLVRGQPVVGERYLFDLWLDPLRYRLDLPGGSVPDRGGLRVLAPDITLCLMADAGVLQSRKSEVSIETTERQLAAIAAMAHSTPSAHEVNVALTEAEVLDSCERVVLDWLFRRDSRRHSPGTVVTDPT